MGVFRQKFSVQFLPQIFTLGGFCRGWILFLNFLTPKRHTLAWDRVVWAIARENRSRGLTCRRVTKKRYIYKSEKVSLYFTHLPRSPPWTDLHEIWHRGSCPEPNHPWQIFCQSVKGFRFYRGSNFGIPRWLRQPPLIQCCATARLWCYYS